MNISRLLPVFSFLFIASMLTGFSQSKDEAAVNQAVAALRKLMIDPDKAGLEALTSDALTYGHSTGRVENKKEFIQALISEDSDFKTIDLTDQTTTITDNTAVVRHKLMAETADFGKPGQAKLSVLLIWVKQKNAWKLVARQAVKI